MTASSGSCLPTVQVLAVPCSVIGSAAGVVVMGLEKITFGWYMKHITWVAFVGYFIGILAYYLQRVVLGI